MYRNVSIHPCVRVPRVHVCMPVKVHVYCAIKKIVLMQNEDTINKINEM